MKKLTPGQNCFYAALNRYLIYEGLTLEEEESYFLCGGVNLYRYGGKFENARYTYAPYERLLARIARCIGMTLQKMQLEEMDAEHGPLLVCVDPDILEYQPLHAQVPYVHFLVLKELAGDMAWLEDPFVLDGSGHVSVFEGDYAWSTLRKGIKAVFALSGTPRPVEERQVGEACRKELHIFCTRRRTPRAGGQVVEGLFHEILHHAQSFETNRLLELVLLLKTRHLPLFEYLPRLLERDAGQVPHSLLEKLEKQRQRWETLFIRLLMADLDESKERMERACHEALALCEGDNALITKAVNWIAKEG